MASEEFRPRKNTLSVTLTESVVFLRAVDLSTRRSAAHENAPPSMLRGLLVLNLVKPTHISSIQVELVGQSVTTWSGARQVEMRDENKLFSATQTFFRAYRSSTNRRTLPVDHEPGLSDSDENDFTNRRLPSSPSPTRDWGPTQPSHSSNLPRGRERVRSHLGANDDANHHRAYTQETLSHSPITLHSLSPASPGVDASTLLVEPPRARSHVGASDTPSRSPLRHLSPTVTPTSSPMDSPYQSRSFSQPPSIPRPLPSSRPTSRTPSLSHLPLSTTSGLRRLHHHDISSPSSRRVSFDEDREYSPLRSRSQSRGRKRSRFSLTSVSSLILEAMRNVSGTSRERVNSRCREQNGDDVHSPHPHHLSGKVGEAVVLDDNIYKDSGEGWCEFQKGTYTYPISFVIPSHMPPTIHCDHGFVTWSLKATVHRPGTFTPKLSASREVTFVASPSEDNRDDFEGLAIERLWEDQMQYVLSISGRVVPIGGIVPMTLSFLPMSKVRIYRIFVQLEERVDYFTFTSRARRTEATRCFNLLSLQSKDKNSPLLPLPQTVNSPTDSPLYSLGPNDNPSEVTANLMGPGPWSFYLKLTVPSAIGTLHVSNKNKRAPIRISHVLKIVIRVERGDNKQVDPKTGKSKQSDIVMQLPVHILSPLSNAQHIILPRYCERLDTLPPLPPSCMSCGSCQNPNLPRFEAVTLQEGPSHEVGTLYERNVTFERLITGQQSEDGALPPAYSAAQ